MARVRVELYEPGMAELRVRANDRAVRPLTEDVAQDMRRFVPVLTGDLKATIRTDFTGRARDASGRFAGLAGRVWFGDVNAAHGRGVVVDYHLYVEYGTSKMDAQPFARPALYRVRVIR